MPENLEQIRFITANYSRLQGLRAVPVGVFIGLAGIWASLSAGDLSAPLVLLLVTALAYLGVERYYARYYGKVVPTRQERTREIIIAVFFGVLAFASFVFDTSETLPISSMGLVFALGMLVDFGQAMSKRNKLEQYPEAVASALFIAIASLLPLTGLHWWKLFGMSTSSNGMLVLLGTLLILAGLAGHFRFTNALKKLEEARHA
jgi:hypothetical protein